MTFTQNEMVKMNKSKIKKTRNWFRDRNELHFFYEMKNSRIKILDFIDKYYFTVKLIDAAIVFSIPHWMVEKIDFKDVFDNLKRND